MPAGAAVAAVAEPALNAAEASPKKRQRAPKIDIDAAIVVYQLEVQQAAQLMAEARAQDTALTEQVAAMNRTPEPMRLNALAATVTLSFALISTISNAAEIVRTATPISGDQMLSGSECTHPILPAE